VIHVGGTNGKGSTAAMCEAVLRAGGLRTGLYTSPHLGRFTERIRIGGVEIDRERLGGLHLRARRMIEELTFFEQATILGLLAFADAGVEATVLEVGLGGRLDATNVVDADVAVVTGVALDHADVLGATLAEIAAEKGGIFKPGRVAVIGRGGLEEGAALLATEARRRGAGRVIVAGDLPPGWQVGLRGAHQRLNGAAALAAIDALGGVPEAARRQGLAEARWPGRFEELTVAASDGSPRAVVLDGAHNPHAAAALATAMDEIGGTWIAVAGVSADKDAAGVLAPILSRSRLLITTEAPSPRALPAATLAQAAAPPDPRTITSTNPDYRQAIRAALDEAQPGERVLIFGSLFLVGAARAHLLGEPTDPLAAQDPAATPR